MVWSRHRDRTYLSGKNWARGPKQNQTDNIGIRSKRHWPGRRTITHLQIHCQTDEIQTEATKFTLSAPSARQRAALRVLAPALPAPAQFLPAPAQFLPAPERALAPVASFEAAAPRAAPRARQQAALALHREPRALRRRERRHPVVEWRGRATLVPRNAHALREPSQDARRRADPPPFREPRADARHVRRARRRRHRRRRRAQRA